ncbi:MAG: CIA30 family protein [Xanthomonadales bacterium]|nr:CIA30 family protein [Xanthomonadales bacterium]
MPLDTENMNWLITNDRVMGGRSNSRAVASGRTLRFEGELSLANGGGFASVLADLETPLNRFHGIRLTVAGDGRRYQLRLRESRASRGVAWRAEFEASDTPQRILLGPDAFEAVIRGEKVIGARPLAQTAFKHLGFMLARGAEGPFRLEVRDIEFVYPAEENGVRLVVGAGRGIGRALLEAQLASPEVKRVIATYRPGSERSALDKLQAQWGERLVLHPLDLTQADSLAAFETLLGEQEGSIDLAIHAAGILHGKNMKPEKSIEDCSPETLEQIFRVNSIAPLMVARALLRSQSRQRRFTFAALSAMVGSIGDNRLGGWYGYRASKAALNQFMRTLANECRHRFPNAIVLAIHPGTTDTGLSRPFQGSVPAHRLYPPETTASRILQLAAGLGAADNGHFFNWDGTQIPW